MDFFVEMTSKRSDATCHYVDDRVRNMIFPDMLAARFQMCIRDRPYIIQFITNRLPETGRIVPWLRLFAFAGRMVV